MPGFKGGAWSSRSSVGVFPPECTACACVNSAGVWRWPCSQHRGRCGRGRGVCVRGACDRWLALSMICSLEPCLPAGDVSPISMSPISQSQFIPLGEILCLAISAMNSARKPVTQEALMEHLTTCFPGNGRSRGHSPRGRACSGCARTARGHGLSCLNLAGKKSLPKVTGNFP